LTLKQVTKEAPRAPHQPSANSYPCVEITACIYPEAVYHDPEC